MQDIRHMTLGQVVDYCIDYNRRAERAQRQKDKPVRRMATQAEIDAF